MALLAPPTPWLPLKVMVTLSCRSVELCTSAGIAPPPRLLDFFSLMEQS